MSFSQFQNLSVTVIVKCTSFLSFSGSAWIAQEIIRDHKNRKMIYHRLLLAMSISDIFSSFWMFVGTWAIPSDTAGVFMPHGNKLSCSIQGFFIQLGIMTPIYNASLSLVYLLIINYGWKEASLQKLEPYLYLLTLAWGFGTSIAGAVWDQYHNSNLWCWLSSTPESNILRWVFYYGPGFIVLTIVTVTVLMVCYHVYSKEKQMDKYDFAHDNASTHLEDIIRLRIKGQRKQSRKVIVQSFLYASSFYAAFIFASLTRLIQTINGKTYYPLLLLFAMFSPLQGFMNFCVYMRPRFTAYMKDKRRKREGTATKMANTVDINNNI